MTLITLAGKKKHIDYTDQTNYTDRARNINQSEPHSSINKKINILI